jgi:hypothetical protein
MKSRDRACCDGKRRGYGPNPIFASPVFNKVYTLCLIRTESRTGELSAKTGADTSS